MKRSLLTIIILIIIGQSPLLVKAQAAEAAQLALNIEKLAQLKSILTSLKKGFDIVSKGYGKVKSLTEGNFSIHKLFLDGLLEVSPAVKKYRKVASIIDYQLLLVKEYKSAFERSKRSNLFNPDEISYQYSVYENLVNSSLNNLDELLHVITASKLRMSDDERLAAIDSIYADMEDKIAFLRSFNDGTALLALQRRKEKAQVDALRTLHGINTKSN